MFTLQTLAVLAGICLIAYLLGSLNFAIILTKIFAKDDIRKYGSGNAGMTNMLRTYGKGPAIFTALGDFLKAVAAVCVARLLDSWLMPGLAIDAGYLAAIFVIVGHLFPLYFRFKGGKGVMAALGSLLSVNPPIFLIVVVAAVPLIFITRIISIASISGALVFGAVSVAWAFLFTQYPWYYAVCSLAISAMILVVHRENIGRLIAGTENRLGGKKK